MISSTISYIYIWIPSLMACATLPLQRLIFPRHSALMQAMAAMIWTEKWTQTRRVTMLINPLCHGRWQSDSSNTFETYALLYECGWHWAATARNYHASACSGSSQDLYFEQPAYLHGLWLGSPAVPARALISDNYGHELGIPPKGYLEWTAGELNVILEIQWKTTWTPATVAKYSFVHSAAFSRSVSATAEAWGPGHDAIPSTWQATAFGERTVRYTCFMWHDIIHDIMYDIR